MITDFVDEMVIFSDPDFHTKAGDPRNPKVCKRGTWNRRMVIERVLSMLTSMCHIKKLRYRTWTGFAAQLAFTLAIFNVLVQWDGIQTDADGNICLAIARFSL